MERSENSVASLGRHGAGGSLHMASEQWVRRHSSWEPHRSEGTGVHLQRSDRSGCAGCFARSSVCVLYGARQSSIGRSSNNSRTSQAESGPEENFSQQFPGRVLGANGRFGSERLVFDAHTDAQKLPSLSTSEVATEFRRSFRGETSRQGRRR